MKTYEVRIHTKNEEYAKDFVIETRKRGRTNYRLQKKKDAEEYSIIIPGTAHNFVEFKFWEVIMRGVLKLDEKLYVYNKTHKQQEA